MSTLKDMIRLAVEKAIAEVVGEMTSGGKAEHPDDTLFRQENGQRAYGQHVKDAKRSNKVGGFPKGPRVMYHVGRRMGQRELAEMRPNDRKAYNYVVKHAPCSAAQVEQGTGLGRKATESALWSLRKGNNAGAIKSKPIA